MYSRGAWDIRWHQALGTYDTAWDVSVPVVCEDSARKTRATSRAREGAIERCKFGAEGALEIHHVARVSRDIRRLLLRGADGPTVYGKRCDASRT